jgi:hypothetical protein
VQGRPKGSGKLAAQMDFLTGRVKAQPDITMPELAAELLAARRVKVNPASLSRALCKVSGASAPSRFQLDAVHTGGSGRPKSLPFPSNHTFEVP